LRFGAFFGFKSVQRGGILFSALLENIMLFYVNIFTWFFRCLEVN